MTNKTICLENSKELHIDPVGDQLELAVKERARWGLHELSRIRLTRQKRDELAAILIVLGLGEAEKRRRK